MVDVRPDQHEADEMVEGDTDIGALGVRLFASRHGGAELLDQPGLPPEDVAANLADLELVNRRLGGARSVLAHVGPALEGVPAPATARVLDIACGAGDVLRSLAQRTRSEGRAMLGVGVDLNPLVIAYARARAADLPELLWVRANALRLPFAPRSFDLVICSTFLHHLSPEGAVTLLRQARKLSRGWLIAADLGRSRMARLGFPALAWLAGFHPVTRYDGAVSLRRAYTPAELTELARAAGLTNWRVHGHRFSRMTLVCGPDGGPDSRSSSAF